MENKLEQLLNVLIEKGWKPFGALGKAKNSVYTDYYFFFEGCADGKTLRQIVSKESGLWQFVCENKLLPKKNGYVWNLIDHYDFDKTIKWLGEYNSLYYIIESALKDESELEEFLLSNIKVNAI